MNQCYQIAGIQRKAVYSPNRVDHDAAIFHAVKQRLEQMGHRVTVYQEDDLATGNVKEKFIFNMVRSHDAVAKLQELEKQGAIAINSGFGIENCSRELMTTLLLAHEVPYPKSCICEVKAWVAMLSLSIPCWVKRADGHTVCTEDVTYVDSLQELGSVMHRFAMRGVGRVVVNEHLPGDLIKFYGVKGTDFFYWSRQPDKFGLDAINGASSGYLFSGGALQTICTKAASVLGVDVYGGDAIIASDGAIRIIDFNDWPSFAPCCNDGAEAITQAIISKFE